MKIVGRNLLCQKRTLIVLVLAAIFSAVVWVQKSEAATLRGRVDAITPYGRVVRPSALVEIFPVNYQGRPLSTTTSGADGLFYFQGIAPGTYQIWINRSVGPYMVQVGTAALQDLPPFLAR